MKARSAWLAGAGVLLAAGAAGAAQVAPGGGGGSPAGFSSAAWDFLVKGGPTMVPIGLCSIIGLALVFERMFSLRRKKIIPDELVHASTRFWRRGDLEEAGRLCERFEVPLARILRAGLARRHLGLDEMERAIIGSGQHEFTTLSRGLRGLGVIANIAPMLGFFGTVTGMLSAFEVISHADRVTPALVAAGISEALITTVAGLAVGIPTLAAYHYFRARADRFLFEMETIAIELLDVLANVPGMSQEGNPAPGSAAGVPAKPRGGGRAGSSADRPAEEEG